MDELFKASNLNFSTIAVPTLLDFILGYLVAIICSSIIAYTYKKLIVDILFLLRLWLR